MNVANKVLIVFELIEFDEIKYMQYQAAGFLNTKEMKV
jgi:hypothetical protein